ncbi:hypothetical protein J2Z62_000410 [Mycoplasmoides fastidiosum]|uniref:Lipoprotein n=1 Tax=Mycoplasmoides fastidiosum TaxID=92758 RepID=A0ABU0LZ43_9BACT|nr:hypothetical protein [Mycoplasmoides fastidiosum]MDQ0513972.1 hypothetical protein [Mycoplasmoides fastidiosum]UUD37614.1 hypothetical protein NPA10_03540 [Mycoplasmoides fastidiosum]
MKKLNLFKKNKLWLAGLGIATMSSLVLGACGTNDITPSNNSNSINNNSEQHNPDNSEGANSSKNTSEPNIPIIPQATENQLAAAKILLQTPTIKTVLNNNKSAAWATITANLLTVNEVGIFSQDTVKDAKTALGVLTSTALTEVDQSKAEAASVMTLINTLETQLKTAENDPTIVPNNKKDQFRAAVNEVKVQTNNLLAKLNALPTKVGKGINLLDDVKKNIWNCFSSLYSSQFDNIKYHLSYFEKSSWKLSK